MVLAEKKCLVVVKRIRVLGPQETLIHAAPEVRCNDLTTTALEAAEAFCTAVLAQLCAAVAVL